MSVCLLKQNSLPYRLDKFPEFCYLIIIIKIWGISAVGSASHWQCGGQGFESPMLHHSCFGQLTTCHHFVVSGNFMPLCKYLIIKTPTLRICAKPAFSFVDNIQPTAYAVLHTAVTVKTPVLTVIVFSAPSYP